MNFKKKFILTLIAILAFNATTLTSFAQPVDVSYVFYNDYEQSEEISSFSNHYDYEPGDVFDVPSLGGQNYYFRYQLSGYESFYWQGGLYCIIGGDSYETGVFTHDGWIDVRNATMVNGPVDIIFNYSPYADYFYTEHYLQNEDGTYPDTPTEVKRTAGLINETYPAVFLEYEGYTADEGNENSILSGQVPLRQTGEPSLTLRCYYTLDEVEEPTEPETEPTEPETEPTTPAEEENTTPAEEPTLPTEKETTAPAEEETEPAAVPTQEETEPVVEESPVEEPETTAPAVPMTPSIPIPQRVYTAVPVTVYQTEPEPETEGETEAVEPETELETEAGPETIEEEEIPLVISRSNWALVNLILVVLTCLALAKKHNDERRYNILSFIVPIVAILAFVFLENVRDPMVIVNHNTVLMAILYVLQVLSRLIGKKKQNNKTEEEDN